MKKLFTLLVISVLGYGLYLGHSYHDIHMDRLHPKLRWNIAAPLVVIKDGQWSLTVDSSKQQLILESATGVSWFSTTPGQAFVGGSFDSVSAFEKHGSFQFRHNIETPCETQTVDTVDEQKDSAEVGGLLFCGGRDYAWSLKFRTQTPQSVALELNLDPQLKRANLHFESHGDEKFFGGGAQFTHLNLKGKAVPLWVSEQGIGRGIQPLTFLLNLVGHSGGNSFTTSYSSGAFVSSKNRGLVVHSYPRTIVDFQNSDWITVDHWGSNLNLTLSFSDSVKNLLTLQSEITGRMRTPPEWFYRGAILGVQGGSQTVLAKLKALLDAGANVSGLWIQDWVGQRYTSLGSQLWWNWQLDTQHYKDWESFKNSVQEKNIHLLGYLNPRLVQTTHPQSDLLSEALESDYLVKNKQNQPLSLSNSAFSYYLLDVSNPNARQWFLSTVSENFLQLGFEGWMADFGDSLPMDVQLQNGAGKDYHNQYAEDWVQLNRELVESQKQSEDFVFFNRTGFSQAPSSSTMFWLGDQMVTWDRYDGLHSTLLGLLSSGLSGATFNHSDIGGYTSINYPGFRYLRDEELLIRWMELNIFTSVFRNHEGNLPEKNIQVYSTSQIRRAYAHYTQLFANLFEYRIDVFKEATEKGWPVVRPVWLEFPLNKNSWNLEDQFMLGSDILVAPILKPGQKERQMWLPPGEWVHLMTGEVFQAPEAGFVTKLSAPLGQPLAFIKSSSIWKDSLKLTPLILEQVEPASR